MVPHDAETRKMVRDVAYAYVTYGVTGVPRRFDGQVTRVQGGCISRVLALVSGGCLVYIRVVTCCLASFEILTLVAERKSVPIECLNLRVLLNVRLN